MMKEADRLNLCKALPGSDSETIPTAIHLTEKSVVTWLWRGRAIPGSLQDDAGREPHTRRAVPEARWEEAGRGPHTGLGYDAGRSLELQLTGNDKARFLTNNELKSWTGKGTLFLILNATHSTFSVKTIKKHDLLWPWLHL
jgi:hypothetical protein